MYIVSIFLAAMILMLTINLFFYLFGIQTVIQQMESVFVVAVLGFWFLVLREIPLPIAGALSLGYYAGDEATRLIVGRRNF